MSVLIDAHAHLHSADLDPALDAASDNFQAASRTLGLAPSGGFLLLAEPVGGTRFSCLHDEDGRWSLGRTADAEAVLASNDNRLPICLVAGRQIVTREGLEVHALATTRDFEDGMGWDETIVEARSSGSVVVLPWGVGKWFGARGRRVEEALAAHEDLLVSDNGGRPWCWPARGSLARQGTAGRGVLAGSDPLPLGEDWRRLGSYGVVADVTLDMARPIESLRSAVSADVVRRPYGRRRGVLPFVSQQIRMQIRKGR